MIPLRQTLRNNRLLYFIYGCLLRLKFEIQASAATFLWKWSSRKTETEQAIPPPRLRHRVHGCLDYRSFKRAGSENFISLVPTLDQLQKKQERPLKVLDFGCGCARTLVHFLTSRPHWHYTGTDIDSQAIEWNSKHLTGKADWYVNECSGPLPFGDEEFDAILAVSLFTHLDENLQDFWLQEFKRILKTTGIVLATVHGKTVWEKNPKWTEDVEKSGLLYLRTNVGIRNLAQTPDHYQTTLHSKSYIVGNWSRIFANIQYEENAINNWQDLVVLSH